MVELVFMERRNDLISWQSAKKSISSGQNSLKLLGEIVFHVIVVPVILPDRQILIAIL